MQRSDSLASPPPLPPPLRPRTGGPRRAALVGLVASGVATALLTKIAYQTGCPAAAAVGGDAAAQYAGAGDEEHAFQKPWFMVLVMFAGMTLCLPAALALQLLRCGRGRRAAVAAGYGGGSDGAGAPLLDQLADADALGGGGESDGWSAPSVAPSLARAWRRLSVERQLLHLTLPAVFDLAGALLQGLAASNVCCLCCRCLLCGVVRPRPSQRSCLPSLNNDRLRAAEHRPRLRQRERDADAAPEPAAVRDAGRRRALPQAAQPAAPLGAAWLPRRPRRGCGGVPLERLWRALGRRRGGGRGGGGGGGGGCR